MSNETSRRFTEQFLTFYVNINGRPWAQRVSDEEAEALWAKNSPLLEALYRELENRHSQLPGFRTPETSGGYTYEQEQWEICEDEFSETEHAGLVCHEFAFCRTLPFTQEQVGALLELVRTVAKEVGDANGAKVDVVGVRAQSTYTVTESEMLDVL